MNDASTPTWRSNDLLLKHCDALTPADERDGHAFHRLEQAVGGELARLLVVALSEREGKRRGLAA